MTPTKLMALALALGASAGNHAPAMTTRALELERRKRELAAWNAEAMTRRRYSPELAAVYREQRIQTKRLSRSKGHGTG